MHSVAPGLDRRRTASSHTFSFHSALSLQLLQSGLGTVHGVRHSFSNPTSRGLSFHFSSFVGHVCRASEHNRGYLLTLTTQAPPRKPRPRPGSTPLNPGGAPNDCGVSCRPEYLMSSHCVQSSHQMMASLVPAAGKGGMSCAKSPILSRSAVAASRACFLSLCSSWLKEWSGRVLPSNTHMVGWLPLKGGTSMVVILKCGTGFIFGKSGAPTMDNLRCVTLSFGRVM